MKMQDLHKGIPNKQPTRVNGGITIAQKYGRQTREEDSVTAAVSLESLDTLDTLDGETVKEEISLTAEFEELTAFITLCKSFADFASSAV